MIDWVTMRRGALGLGLGLGLGMGCSGNVFLCSSDDDCDSGRCEVTGYCSFPDESCDSGHRYGDHVGGELAGQCVAPDDGTGETSGPSSSLTTPESSTTDGGTIPDPDGGLETSTTTGSVDDSSGDRGTESTGSTSTGEPRPRVEDGLLVLYTFHEGSGLQITDVSGYDPALGLMIDAPGEGVGYAWASDGLELSGARARSSGTNKVNEVCKTTNEITVEAWVTPSIMDLDQSRRIVSVSGTPQLRNFTLGQGYHSEGMTDMSQYIARLRTDFGIPTPDQDNGLPTIFTPSGVAMEEPTHLVYARNDAGSEWIYVNGDVQVTNMRPGGFSTWETDWPLLLGDENNTDFGGADDRRWYGILHLVAIYERDLDPTEIDQNYEARY